MQIHLDRVMRILRTALASPRNKPPLVVLVKIPHDGEQTRQNMRVITMLRLNFLDSIRHAITRVLYVPRSGPRRRPTGARNMIQTKLFGKAHSQLCRIATSGFDQP